MVCFDLAVDQQQQRAQIRYWLDYLHSLLATHAGRSAIPDADAKSKWRVILVGLRSDLHIATSKVASFSADWIRGWQQAWPDLPLHQEPFMVSKFENASVTHLFQVVKQECKCILNTIAKKIPRPYLRLLNKLQKEEAFIVDIQDLQKYMHGISDKLLPALHYLHATGDVVLFDDGTVCLRPSEISSMIAQFISPDSVQQHLPHITSQHAEILTTEQVGRILQLNVHDPKYYPYPIFPIFEYWQIL